MSPASTAIRTLHGKGYRIDPDAVRSGVARTVWKGRFSCVMEHPVFLLDGAHNEDAALKLRESMESYFPEKKLICIMGVFKDKEYEKITDIMCPLASSVHTVSLPDAKRTLPAAKLAGTVRGRCPDINVKADESVDQAVREALDEADREDVILAFGSLSYLEQVKEALDQERGVGK